MSNLINLLSTLKAGESLPISPRDGERFSSFRTRVFSELQSWKERKTIKVKSDPSNNRLIVVKLRDGEDSHSEFSLLLSAASPKTVKKFEELLPLNWDQLRKTEIEEENSQALYLYLAFHKPWKRHQTSTFSNREQDLEMTEMEKEIFKGFNDKISEQAGFFSGISGLAVKVSDVKVC